MTATVRDVVAALEAACPPALAASWDAVGLVCGDPTEPVHRVLIAVDPVAETVAEALEPDAQLLVTHHLLLLRGVHGVPADDPKGGLVHRLGAGNPLLGAANAAGVDVAHWASEHPWCAQAVTVLTAALGSTVDVHLSYRRTDPWTIGSAQRPGRLPR